MNKNQNLMLAIIALTALTVSSPHALAQRWGGDRGGGDSRGDRGDRGGRGGGDPRGGGGRGGFDPADMLKRLDTNNNGVLDPDEQAGGPGKFIVDRMARSDSSIKPGTAIPLNKISDAFQKMRGGGDDRGRDDRGRGDSRQSDPDAGLTAMLLVPGFGIEEDPIPPLGFGPNSAMMAVEVRAEDKAEAEKRIREFDRDNDGQLSSEELRRFAGNPLDFDSNQDGKLSAVELSVRYARRREVKQTDEAARNRGRQDRGRGERDSDTSEVDYFNGRKSYRILDGSESADGVPGFFFDKDSNQDGQVTMAEFADEWTDELINEFFKSDLNRDGIITVEEVLQAVEQGVQVNAPKSNASSSGSASSDSASGGGSSSGGKVKVDAKLLQYAERIIERNDTNKDKVLTASEWESMLMNPSPADTNRDGRITSEEYALWMQQRSKR